MELPLPFLKHAVGAGDIVKTVASALGFQQRVGCGCPEKHTRYNDKLMFVPATPLTGVVGQQLSIEICGQITEGAIPPGMRLAGRWLNGRPTRAGLYRLILLRDGQRRPLTIQINEAQ